MIVSKSNSERQNEVCTLTKEDALEILRPILDPDIGISIVDLGLIYDVVNTDGSIAIDMTFTTPACPHGPQLVSEVEYMMRATAGVKEVTIDVVWDPPWSMDCINEATKLELGLDL